MNRVFVSYATEDLLSAQDLVARIGRVAPQFDLYFAPRSNVGGSYWMPRLGDELAMADTVLLLLGSGIGPWQELEYFEALRLNRASGKPRVVPVLLGDEAPGLPFLEQFHRLRLASGVEAATKSIQAALAGAVVPEDPTPAWRETNPYRGLSAYASQHAAFFFGREVETNALIDALAARGGEVLTLVGNSGVGKSSLVFAGVFAALRSRMRPAGSQRDWPAALSESHRWQSVVVRPGQRPLKALARGFTRLWLDDPAAADAQANAWARNLDNGSELDDLAGAADDRLAAAPGATAPAGFLLYVDQGEELYLGADGEQAARFSTLLARAAEHPAMAVLMSIRADFYGRLQADPALFPATRRIDVAPLGPEALADVIAKPAARLGARFETPELVSAVAEAAARETGALPLLSFLMEEAWEKMRAEDGADGVIRLPSGLVDVGRPLADRAEGWLAARPGREDALRRLLTLRLAHVPKAGEAVRRRAARTDCRDDEWAAALELAGPEWRLITMGEESGVPMAEVAHEMLLRKWPRLAGWLEEEREFLIWRSHFEAVRADWEAAPEDWRNEAVLTGLGLAAAREWLAARRDGLSAADRAFIERSAKVAEEQRDADLRRARELAEERERSRRRAMWISRGALAAAIVLLGFGAWALAERQRAETAAVASAQAQRSAEASAAAADRERRNAEASVARFFATEAVALDPADDGALAVLLGVEAVRLDQTTQTDGALRTAIRRNLWEPLAAHRGAVLDIALSQDGAAMASVGVDGTVRLWDLDDPERPHRILHRAERPASAVVLAGAHLAAAVGGAVLLWSLDDLDAAPETLEGAGSGDAVLALTRDGAYLFVASDESSLLHDLSDRSRPPTPLSHKVPIRAAAFSPDGATLALAGGGAVALIDLAEPGASPTPLTADQAEVYAIAISGDGSRLVTLGFEPLGFRYASVWRLDELDAGSTVVRASIGMMDMAYTASALSVSADGAQLIVGADDGAVRLWLPDEPERNRVLFTAQNSITQTAIASQSSIAPRRWLAAADGGGFIHLYDMTGGGLEPRRFGGLDSWPMALDASVDGAVLVTGLSGGAVVAHDTAHPERGPRALHRAPSDVRSVAHHPNGRLVALGDSEGGVVLLDVGDDPESPRALQIAEGIVGPLVFAPGGDRLLVADATGLLDVDPSTGSATRLETGSARVRTLRATVDGVVVAVTAEGRLLEWADGTRGATELADFGAPVLNAAFSHDGALMALTRSNHLVEVRSLTAPEAAPVRLDSGFRGDTMSIFGYPVAFSPDGRWLAMKGGDAPVRLWRTDEWSREPLVIATQGLAQVDVAFTPDGAHLIVGGGAGAPPTLWSMPETLLQRACSRAGRNLAAQEWRRYWGERRYARTCTDWPLPDDLVREIAEVYVHDADATAVLDALREALGPATGQSRAEVDAEHRARLAEQLVWMAIDVAEHDGTAAVRRLAAARAIDPSMSLSGLGVSAAGWNRLCWRGALAGHAHAVLQTCDLAVESAPRSRRAHFRDSRGLARALLGDVAAALADFEALVQWAKEEALGGEAIDRRRRWIETLRAGDDPFDAETLEELQRESL